MCDRALCFSLVLEKLICKMASHRTIPRDYLQLMRDCWAERALQRPSFEDIIVRLEGMEQDGNEQCRRHEA